MLDWEKHAKLRVGLYGAVPRPPTLFALLVPHPVTGLICQKGRCTAHPPNPVSASSSQPNFPINGLRRKGACAPSPAGISPQIQSSLHSAICCRVRPSLIRQIESVCHQCLRECRREFATMYRVPRISVSRRCISFRLTKF